MHIPAGDRACGQELASTHQQGDFTYATNVALCKGIKLHLPNVANTATMRDGQDARVAQLIASFRTEWHNRRPERNEADQPVAP